MQHGVAFAEIGIEGGQRCQLTPNGVVGELLLHELLTPGNDVCLGNLPELLRSMHAGIRHKIFDVLLIGPPSVGVGEVGKPFKLGGNLGEGLKLIGGEGGR